MPSRIAITGASGKIGGAVLDAIIEYKLASPGDLVVATSSKSDHPRLSRAASLGVTIRPSNYDSVKLMTEAFAGCEKLFLVSTPHIDLDFHNCAKGGREKHHFHALEAAKRAGVRHVYYTSLAFQEPSKAGVMRAHLRTEEYLKAQKDYDFTILREGLYNDSWPLYLGHFEISGDKRDKIVIGPDGPVSWTAIEDLGLASGLILTGNSNEWAGRTLWLSAKATATVAEVASLVGRSSGKPLSVDIRTQDGYIEHYTHEKNMDAGMIEWWSSTYLALQDHECSIQNSPFEDLIASKGRKPKPIEKTVSDMIEANLRK